MPDCVGPGGVTVEIDLEDDEVEVIGIVDDERLLPGIGTVVALVMTVVVVIVVEE